jgi:hypothetical protein
MKIDQNFIDLWESTRMNVLAVTLSWMMWPVCVCFRHHLHTHKDRSYRKYLSKWIYDSCSRNTFDGEYFLILTSFQQIFHFSILIKICQETMKNVEIRNFLSRMGCVSRAAISSGPKWGTEGPEWGTWEVQIFAKWGTSMGYIYGVHELLSTFKVIL